MNEKNDTSSTPLYNVQQAADFLGVNVGTIRRSARSKTLTGLNVGIRGDWRFTKADLLAMVKPNHKTKNKFFPIVGIGASAGGLEAVTQLLHALPTNSGIGFVLIQHLDPTHESILADLLSRATAMPVEEAKDNMRVDSNHVYVIPHNKDMTISDGILRLTNRSESNKLHMPIDRFFSSLAKSQREKAIGIILSGTASDGTLGLKEIKDHGGFTFAQDKTAKYQGMPNAAIASGFVDFVFSPVGIANELIKMNSNPYIKPQTMADNQALHEDEDELQKIFFILRRSSGIDFRHYKEATIKRRIRRRMLLKKIKTLKEYIDYLKENSGEIESLHNDLLINVTSFFREQHTLQFLRDTIFPRLIKTMSPQDPIRIWVPGCATGEEVYSIAMLLTEFLSEKSAKNSVQIFGTDLSKTAIEKARSGAYTKNETENISSKLLTKYFEQTDGVYQINKSIRDLCVFAQHNVFGDPPFSKLDLISCCNLLIYLDLSLQEKILRAFHYALKSGGVLILGKSETVGNSSELFSQINKKYKIYSRKDTLTRNIFNFGTLIPKLEKQNSNKLDDINENIIDSVDIQKEADAILLSHYTPASVVLNNDLDIIQFRGSTGEYLEPSPGKPSFNLIKMARGNLGFEIRSAISKVRKSGNSFRKDNIALDQSANTRSVTIEVLPLKKALESHYLVLFEETKKTTIEEHLPHQQKVLRYSRGAKDQRITVLETELIQTREQMRSITEEQETTNEELQTASEEILSSNEELQSINEELETSKEELESTNEELTTVNEELQNRNEQLTEARNYTAAIIRTVQLPLLILDRDLRVKTTNRAFLEMFQVKEVETIGNFIYELGDRQWDIPALRKLLNEILPKNNAFDNYEIEHIFPLIGHKVMQLNARRFYKDGENILLVIEDITDRRQLEKQKDDFIGIVSHELKTPLTTIKAFTQLLEKHLNRVEDKKGSYFLSKMTNQMERLTQLMASFVNVYKIQDGKLALHKKHFQVDELLSSIVSDFQFTTKSYSITNNAQSKTTIYADRERIAQVLVNLISNAIKYSPNGDKIIVASVRDTDNVTISIQDFGLGIPKEEQGKIFGRFFRVKAKREMDISGLGLGLYISYEIISQHKGKIWVESTEGKGSTFSFSLPVK